MSSARPTQSEPTGRALFKGLAFASPFIIGFVILYAWPILASGYYSLTDFSLFKSPSHPYTVQLLRAVPTFPNNGERLYAMGGSVPDLAHALHGCPFAPRCERHLGVGSICDTTVPELVPSGAASQMAACHLA